MLSHAHCFLIGQYVTSKLIDEAKHIVDSCTLRIKLQAWRRLSTTPTFQSLIYVYTWIKTTNSRWTSCSRTMKVYIMPMYFKLTYDCFELTWCFLFTSGTHALAMGIDRWFCSDTSWPLTTSPTPVHSFDLGLGLGLSGLETTSLMITASRFVESWIILIASTMYTRWLQCCRDKQSVIHYLPLLGLYLIPFFLCLSVCLLTG